MRSSIVEALIWTVLLGNGLMAGIYLAFSSFIMRSFATMPVAHGIAAMNAINATILKSPFMPIFFGSTGASIVLIAVGAWFWGEPGTGQAIAAGATYVVGMFAVTAFCNVPLNNALADVGDDDAHASLVWSRYLQRWTRWNTVRALASAASFICCVHMLGAF